MIREIEDAYPEPRKDQLTLATALETEKTWRDTVSRALKARLIHPRDRIHTSGNKVYMSRHGYKIRRTEESGTARSGG